MFQALFKCKTKGKPPNISKVYDDHILFQQKKESILIQISDIFTLKNENHALTTTCPQFLMVFRLSGTENTKQKTSRTTTYSHQYQI